MSNKGFILLVESSDKVDVLAENTENGKQMYIEGIFAQAEVINGNGRYYKRSVMESAIDSYVNDYVSKRRAIGELNHPEYPMADPAEASIRITEMKWVGDNVYGKALVLNTPKGQIVKGLLEGGFNMGVSTRGLGSLKESNGIKYVQPGFSMTAVDCVDNPSGPNCYVDPIMESKIWQMNESTGTWVPRIIKEESDEFNYQLFLEKLEQKIKSLKTKR